MYSLVLVAILGWGIGSLFYKIANDNMHPIMVSSIVTLLFVVLTPLAFTFLKFDHKVTTTGIITALLGGVCMCAGSMGYFFALRGGHAGVITALTSLYPALTLTFSMVFLVEHLSFKQGFGILFALSSFILLGSK
jgi:transporter family protein